MSQVDIVISLAGSRHPSLPSVHTPLPICIDYLGHTTRRDSKSRARHAAASIRGINHFWRKLFIENSHKVMTAG
jgi:hypothetical protein